MEFNSDVRSDFLEHYKYAHDFWSPYTQDASVYNKAAAGETWSRDEKANLAKEGREAMELNIMQRPLQFFSGWLRDNMNAIVYQGIEGSDEKTADQFTKLSYYIWDKGHGYTSWLDGADEAFKSGLSLTGIQMDYTTDFVNGDIGFYYRTYNSFYLDPTFSRIDLSDCGFAIQRDLIGRSQAKSLLPFIDPKVIDEIHRGFRDDKFMSYHPQFTTFSRNRDILAYDQYYVRKSREREFLVDLDSGFTRDITEESGENKRRLKDGLRRLESARREAELIGEDTGDFPNVEIRKVDRPYIELNIMLNGECVYQGMDKTGVVEEYPFVPMICYFEPSIWEPSRRVQGIPARMWSAQRQFNKRHMKIVDMMDSDISTGYKYLIGSVNTEDLQQSGQGKLIGIDPDNAPEGMNSVQELRGGSTNPTILEYQKVLDDLTLQITNVNEASLGMDEKGNTLVSGRLAQVRIAQNLMSNRKVFDNMDASLVQLGKIIQQAIQSNYPFEKVKRIIGEEPTSEFYDRNFDKYDTVVKEGVRTKSQKDAYYYEIVNLAREGIVDVPQSEIIRALGIAGATELRDAIDEQQQQQAEQQEKINEQERVAMELANAQTEQSLALAQERRARVVSDLSLSHERASEAEENRAQAALARAKTITEIAELEDDRILKVLEFVNMLELQEKVDREEVVEDIHQTADDINIETEGSLQNKLAKSTLSENLQKDEAQDGQNG